MCERTEKKSEATVSSLLIVKPFEAHFPTLCSIPGTSHLISLVLDPHQFKQKANAAFKAKKWEEAIENYNKTIKIGGRSHVNLANRAACYLQIGEYEKALEDANECIKLKRDYPKGYSRKGAAYLAMEVRSKGRS